MSSVAQDVALDSITHQEQCDDEAGQEQDVFLFLKRECKCFFARVFSKSSTFEDIRFLLLIVLVILVLIVLITKKGRGGKTGEDNFVDMFQPEENNIIVKLIGFVVTILLVIQSFQKGKEFIEMDVSSTCPNGIGERKGFFSIDYSTIFANILSSLYYFISTFVRMYLYAIIAFCTYYIIYIMMFTVLNTPLHKPVSGIVFYSIAAFFYTYAHVVMGTKYDLDSKKIAPSLFYLTPNEVFKFMNVSHPKTFYKHAFVFLCGLFFTIINSISIPRYTEQEMCNSPEKQKELLTRYKMGYTFTISIVIVLFAIIYFVS